MPTTKFRSGRGYSKEDWNEVSDSPELTEADLVNSRRGEDVLPKSFLAGIEARRRAKVAEKDGKQETVSLRLDRDVLAKFRKRGKDWQARINSTLRKAVGLK